MSPEAPDIPDDYVRMARENSMGEFNPKRLKLEVVNDATDDDGNPLFRFEEPYVFVVPGREDFAAYPEGRTFNGGSIPRRLQGLIRPMEFWFRVPFARHDLKYAIQGGLRYFEDFRTYTLAYEKAPISKARADWELFCDIVVADCGLTWNTMSLTPTRWNVVSFPFRITWRFTRAWLIYFAVAAFGGPSWLRIEPGTSSV